MGDATLQDSEMIEKQIASPELVCSDAKESSELSPPSSLSSAKSPMQELLEEWKEKLEDWKEKLRSTSRNPNPPTQPKEFIEDAGGCPRQLCSVRHAIG